MNWPCPDREPDLEPSPPAAPRSGLTRRAFLGRLTALGLAWGAVARNTRAACAEPSPAPIPAHVARPPVVSFHVDRPYLDRSGCAAPYLPPAGTRSGQAAADLSETDFRRRHAYC